MVYQRGGARPSQLFVDDVLRFQRPASADCHEHARAARLGKQSGLLRVQTAVLQVAKKINTLWTTCWRHATRWHMSNVKVPSNSLNPTDPARTPQTQPYVAIECNSRFASSTKNEKCLSEASRGDDGAKPFGSGTIGPAERLHQSVSISFDHSLGRHWCHGNICTTCLVFSRNLGQNSWCALYSQHIILRTARDRELHTRTQDFALNV